jgi:quercetin dioxygenase-like cupin family protein
VNVPDRVRLPLEFDPGPLAAEALALPEQAWVPHFNQQIYEGDWTGVALRSIGGEEMALVPHPMAERPYADTPTLASLPAFGRALERFACPLKSVRLLALAPGAVINEHRDYWLDWEDGEIRVHVPVVTRPEVEFVLAGRRVDLAPGEAWYLNLNMPHRVANRSAVTRIHLVVDCVVDDWLREMMETAVIPGQNDVD